MAKVTLALVQLDRGNTSNAKSAGEGVQEYRIDWGRVTGSISGGTKQRRAHDIANAKDYRAG